MELKSGNLGSLNITLNKEKVTWYYTFMYMCKIKNNNQQVIEWLLGLMLMIGYLALKTLNKYKPFCDPVCYKNLSANTKDGHEKL